MSTAGSLSPTARATLALAEQAIGLSDPNPRVGCVITSVDGQVLAVGHTQRAGGHHAEAAALAAAREQGIDVRGATVHVSLEPCCHHGRTPPCSQALIDAGVARVEVATLDPNPLVAGAGVQALRAAGLQVEVHEGEWGRASRELNIGFFSRMLRGTPWVRMKIASSLDGTTALLNGQSQWITGEAARADGHAWRKRASAVLTGIGTVQEDNPRLDVRSVSTALQPLRVVVDSDLRIAPDARILQPPGAALIYTTASEAPGLHALQCLPGVEVCPLPTQQDGPSKGKTDLKALLKDLATRGINELHVEAGEKLNGSWLREGLVDELLLYLAPRLLGPGRGLAAIAPQPLEHLQDGLSLNYLEVQTVGADLRVRALTTAGQALLG